MFFVAVVVVHFTTLPGEVSRPEQGIYGAGAHSDYGMITMLATDSVPGLQVSLQFIVFHIVCVPIASRKLDLMYETFLHIIRPEVCST